MGDGEAENFRRLARLDELRKLLRRHRAEGMMDEILKAGVESRCSSKAYALNPEFCTLNRKP